MLKQYSAILRFNANNTAENLWGFQVFVCVVP